MLIYLILFSAIFSSTMIFNGFSLGDLFGVFIIIFVYINNRFTFHYLSPQNHKYILMFLGWILFSALIVFFISDVDILEFIKSFTKLFFYIIVYYSSYTLLRRMPKEKVFKRVSNVILLNSILALYIFVAMYIGMPYQFLWFGLDVPITTAYFGGSLFVRARGIFTEPAFLGYFLVLGEAFLLLNGYKQNKLRLILNWLTIILTFSVTTYFLAFVVIGLYYKENINKIIKISIITIIMGSLIFSIPGFREPIQLSVIDRVVSVLENESAQSSSANTRLNKTWEITQDNLNESYYLGSGLGNHAISFARVNNLDINTEVIESHNVLAYVLGTTGIFGLVLFLGLFSVFKRRSAIGIVFFASLFVNGYFLSLTFWIMYSLFSLNTQKKEN